MSYFVKVVISRVVRVEASTEENAKALVSKITGYQAVDAMAAEPKDITARDVLEKWLADKPKIAVDK